LPLSRESCVIRLLSFFLARASSWRARSRDTPRRRPISASESLRSGEPTTLIAFALDEVAGGTMLTVTESGFDRISLERRAKAFTANEQGWEMQMKLIEKYLADGA